MAAPNQTGPIAVYGATGYTGKLDALAAKLGDVPTAPAAS